MELIRTGQVIETRPRFQKTIWFSLGSAFALLAIGLARSDINWTLAAVFPFLLGTLLLALRAGSRTFIIDEDALTPIHHSPEQPIRWSDVERVAINGQEAVASREAIHTGTIQVRHRNGLLFLPARLNVPSGALYEYLVSKCQPSERLSVPAVLETFRTKQTAKFGEDKIRAVHARLNVVSVEKSPALIVAAAFVLAGIAIVAIAMNAESEFAQREHAEAWKIGGGWMFFIGLVVAIFTWASRSSRKKITKKAAGNCLIMTPEAVAVSQTGEHGLLRWNEIRDVKLGATGAFGSGRPILKIVLAGSEFHLHDLYERPLKEIAALLQQRLSEPS